MKRINIDDLVGKPWRRNGRGPDGYDCYGLAEEVERRFGHEWKRIEDCEKRGYDFNDCLSQWKNMNKIEAVDVPSEAGDVIIMSNGSGVPSHCGVYIDTNMVIHCDRRGVHIDRMSALFGRIVRVYRWK